jgi:hypothetical protein
MIQLPSKASPTSPSEVPLLQGIAPREETTMTPPPMPALAKVKAWVFTKGIYLSQRKYLFNLLAET